jgi:hypothetical protein
MKRGRLLEQFGMSLKRLVGQASEIASLSSVELFWIVSGCAYHN